MTYTDCPTSSRAKANAKLYRQHNGEVQRRQTALDFCQKIFVRPLPRSVRWRLIGKDVLPQVRCNKPR
jgi:hypothetical protein